VKLSPAIKATALVTSEGFIALPIIACSELTGRTGSFHFRSSPCLHSLSLAKLHVTLAGSFLFTDLFSFCFSLRVHGDGFFRFVLLLFSSLAPIFFWSPCFTSAVIISLPFHLFGPKPMCLPLPAKPHYSFHFYFALHRRILLQARHVRRCTQFDPAFVS